jgi:hypothetical protein
VKAGIGLPHFQIPIENEAEMLGFPGGRPEQAKIRERNSLGGMYKEKGVTQNGRAFLLFP